MLERDVIKWATSYAAKQVKKIIKWQYHRSQYYITCPGNEICRFCSRTLDTNQSERHFVWAEMSIQSALNRFLVCLSNQPWHNMWKLVHKNCSSTVAACPASILFILWSSRWLSCKSFSLAAACALMFYGGFVVMVCGLSILSVVWLCLRAVM